MAKQQQNKKLLDSFAWLIHKEVEQYVNEHIAEYELWKLEQDKTQSASKDITLRKGA